MRVCLVVPRLLLAVTGPGLESCLVSTAFKLESQQRESGSQRGAFVAPAQNRKVTMLRPTLRAENLLIEICPELAQHTVA